MGGVPSISLVAHLNAICMGDSLDRPVGHRVDQYV